MKIENVKGLMDVLNGDARNAMHSILGFLELISEEALTPAQREHIEACRIAVDRHFRGIEDARVILGLTPEEKPVITHFATRRSLWPGRRSRRHHRQTEEDRAFL